MIDTLRHHTRLITVLVVSVLFAGLVFYTTYKPSPKISPEITIATSTTEIDTVEARTPSHYTFITQEGDSYTLLARRAVAKYAQSLHISLTPAQSIAAETFLTQDAGSPYLDVSQKIIIPLKSLKNTFRKAQSLSAEDLAAWQNYVPYVEF